MTHRLIGPLALACGAVVFGACGGEESTSLASTAQIDQGAVVYGQTCASCHGADLRGTDKGPSHLSIVYGPNHHGDASFRSAIVNGTPQHHWSYGDMKPVEGLSDDDIEAVIVFVRAEQQRLGFER